MLVQGFPTLPPVASCASALRAASHPHTASSALGSGSCLDCAAALCAGKERALCNLTVVRSHRLEILRQALPRPPRAPPRLPPSPRPRLERPRTAILSRRSSVRANNPCVGACGDLVIPVVAQTERWSPGPSIVLERVVSPSPHLAFPPSAQTPSPAPGSRTPLSSFR